MTLEHRLEEIVRTGPTLMAVLTTARELDLPDWLIFSGAVYQRVLNSLTGRDLDYGIKDYDLGYHDASDISYEAEDAVIRRVAAAYRPPLDALVEVRNQARVHLLKLFDVFPPRDPRVSKARTTLSSLLF